MILAYMCFVPGSLSPARVAALIESHRFGFVPTTIRTDQFGKSGGLQFSTRSLDRLRGLKEVASVSVLGEGGSLRLTGMGGWPAQVLVLETLEWPDEGLIEAASTLPGFVAAMVGDADDAFWQSADQVNTYEVHGRAWQHLPTIRDQVFERDKIDVSVNPGRQVPVPGMWLWAAAKIWFGPGSAALIDRDRVLSLPVGKVSVRDDSVIVVRLFDLSDDIGEIRQVQKALRDWLDYDGLEQRGRELSLTLMDPRIEVEEGVFRSGGVRRVTEWVDRGRLVPRSRATERRCSVLDEDGHVVWQETAPVD